jgi:hypothetical protein
MSLRSELDAMQKQRAREVAVRAALKSMAGGDDAGIEELVPMTPEPTEIISSDTEIITETCQGRQEEIPLVLPPYNPTTNTVARVAKPWESRPGYQIRPLTRREYQQQQDELMDKKALADWARHGEKCQRSYDEKVLLDKQTAARIVREQRTGLRRLPRDPRAAECYISLEEARSRGLLSGGQGEDEE